MKNFLPIATATLAATLTLSACGDASPLGATTSPTTGMTTVATPAAAPEVDASLPLEEQLRDAINGSDAALVGALLDAGVDVDHEYGVGIRPLHVAISAGNAEAVEQLLGAGADVQSVDADGYTPLHHAARFDNEAVVRSLMAAGADWTAQTTDAYNATPLHLATRNDHVDALFAMIDSGADPNVINDDYQATPLMAAAFWGAPGCAELLVQFGADLAAVDDLGDTALALARRNGHAQVATLLEAAGAPE